MAHQVSPQPHISFSLYFCQAVQVCSVHPAMLVSDNGLCVMNIQTTEGMQGLFASKAESQKIPHQLEITHFNTDKDSRLGLTAYLCQLRITHDLLNDFLRGHVHFLLQLFLPVASRGITLQGIQHALIKGTLHHTVNCCKQRVCIFAEWLKTARTCHTAPRETYICNRLETWC